MSAERPRSCIRRARWGGVRSEGRRCDDATIVEEPYVWHPPAVTGAAGGDTGQPELTHDRKVPFMLPDVRTMERDVRIPTPVVMGFMDGKMTHEHIYWDQGLVLAQIDPLDPAGPPIASPERAERFLGLAGS